MTNKAEEKIEELRKELGGIELGVLTQGYTLADAVREGASVTEKATNSFGGGPTACFWSAANLALKARGIE